MKNKGKRRDYAHLSQKERDRLEAMLSSGHKQKEVALVLGRNPATISREIRRNRKRLKRKTKRQGKYKSALAQSKAVYRRKNASYQGMKIENSPKLKKYIVPRLEQDWSPDEIAGRLEKEKRGFRASKNLIYRWLYSSRGQRYCPLLYSKRYRPKKRRGKAKKPLIPNRTGIEKRPELIGKKQRFGDFEGDTIVSAKKTASKVSLAVVVERKSRYIGIRRISSLKPSLFVSAVKEMKKGVRMKSLTLDNGIENRNHQDLKIDTFFCDPYSSWQKGAVENGNRMIRRYIPKGSDIGDYSEKEIREIGKRINKKPRKILGYKTAHEVMCENGMFNNLMEEKIALGG